jgi:hypothetical protein
MENNNPKKSKAFIITFIIILILLILGYYLFSNKDKIFGTGGSLSASKVFSPLLGSSKNTDVKVVDDKTDSVNVTPTVVPKLTGVIITDENGNKIIQSEAGEILKKGDVLYISGFNANKNPIVMKAIAKDKKKSLVFGVAGEDMLRGVLGNVIISGILSGVPTNKKEGTLWAVNNSLYLSDKVYGAMTKNVPAAPSTKALVGSVLAIDKINGSIQIGDLASNLKINSTQVKNLNILNGELLNSSTGDMKDYWSSVFGINEYVNPTSYTGADFSYTNPPFNPISIPVAPGVNPGINPGGPGTNPTTPGQNICSNNATNYPTCTTINNKCINGATNPGACTISIQDKCPNGATNYPTCTTKAGVCVNRATNPDLCTITATEIPPTITESLCPVDDPLSNYFTAQDKIDLENYLRQFYLIAPSIKTEDSIKITENEILDNSSFVGQLKQLIDDCNEQKSKASYTGPQEIMSNPYYQGPAADESATYVSTPPTNSTQPFNILEKLLNIW